MKKLLGSVMVLLAGIMFIPGVFAEVVEWTNQEQDQTYAKVGDITNPDSLVNPDSVKYVFSGELTDNVTITYSAADLKEVPADEKTGRPGGYSWLGLRFTVPTGTTKYSLDSAEDVTLKNGENYDATGHYIDEYVGVDFAKLKAAVEANKDVTYTLTYAWKNENSTISTQTFTIKIVPAGITLQDKDGKNVWDEKIMADIKAAANTTTTTPAKKDDVPKTGSELPMALIGVIALVSVIGAFNLKLAFNKR